MYDIDPDLSTWGKAIANGFSVSALAGKREYMRLGDLEQWDKPRVFLMSTTHGGETHGLAAMMATMDVYKNEPVIEHMIRAGKRLMTGIEQAAARQRRPRPHQRHRACRRTPCSAPRGPDKKPSQEYRCILLQELIKRGVIAPSIVVSYAHKDADIDQTIDAFDGAMEIYAQALSDGAGEISRRPAVGDGLSRLQQEAGAEAQGNRRDHHRHRRRRLHRLSTSRRLCSRAANASSASTIVNDYYDVGLKEARSRCCNKQLRFEFVEADISDRDAMFAIADAHPETTGIVHLAAQAGVRYSRENPYVYIQANVMGQVVMLEAARRLKAA